MQLRNIIGQLELKRKLIQSVHSGRISHTQLFLGSEGTGALPLAVAYAQYMNCANPEDDDSCGSCPSCIKYEKLIHPDLHFTFPTIAIEKKKLSNDFIEDWRVAFTENPYITELQWLLRLDDEGKKQGNITAEECRDIFRKTGLKSFEAKYKVVIIWMAEYLQKEGNILLKLLEEPPSGTLIILVANQSDKVLPTILSRAQTLQIPRLSEEEIKDALISKNQISNTDSETIARVSEGNFSLALSLIHAGRSDYFELFSTWMRLCFNHRKDIENMTKWVEDTSKTGREFLKSFITYCLQMLRAGLIYKYGETGLVRMNIKESEFMNRFSAYLNEENLPKLLAAFDDASFHVERNADLKITFLELSLYIGRLLSSAKQQAKSIQ